MCFVCGGMRGMRSERAREHFSLTIIIGLIIIYLDGFSIFNPIVCNLILPTFFGYQLEYKKLCGRKIFYKLQKYRDECLPHN